MFANVTLTRLFFFVEIVAEVDDKNGFDFVELLELLTMENLPNLPPGGGLIAK